MSVIFQGSMGTFTGPDVNGDYVGTLAPGWTGAVDSGAIDVEVYDYEGVVYGVITIAIPPGQYGVVDGSTPLDPLFSLAHDGTSVLAEFDVYWAPGPSLAKVYLVFPLASGDGTSPVWSWSNMTITSAVSGPPPPRPLSGGLVKDTKISHTPGEPGVPATPGSPYVPGYSTTDVVYNTRVIWFPGGLFYVPTSFTLEQTIEQSVNPARFTAYRETTTVVRTHPATPAVAPTPGIAGTPATTKRDFNIGWNSGAISRKVMEGDCYYDVMISPSAVGIVTGLNDDNRGLGYREIDHGIYFSHGEFQVYEAGVSRGAPTSFVADDLFTVQRLGGTVSYLKNGDAVHTSLVSSNGVVFADASLYMGGDAITAADFNAIGPPIDHSSETSGGSAAASLAPLGAASTNKPYAYSLARLAPLTADAGEGELEPSYAVASGSLVYLLGAAHGLTGEIGGAGASLRALGGLSSNRPYAAATASIAPLGGYAAAGPVVPNMGHSAATIVAPVPKVRAVAYDSTGQNAAHIKGPVPVLKMFFGSTARVSAPAPQVLFAGTMANWLRAAVTAPMGRLTVSATVSGDARAEIVAPMATVVGYGGMVAEIKLTGKPALQATVVSGGAVTAQITGPMARLPLFALTAEAYCSADILAPMGQMGGTLHAWIVAPMARLVAIGTAVVTASYEAYSINLSHKPPAPGKEAPVDEVTHYTNFPFTHIVRFRGSYFGAAADGLYLLEGTTDDGAAIPYAIKTAIDDFRSAEFKTVASAYFGGRLGPEATVTLTAGEDGTESYDYTTPRGQLAQSHREKFGRGVKNRYFAIGVAGEGALELDNIELEINKLTRRI